MHLSVDVTQIDGAHLRLFPQSVAGDRARHLRHDLAHSRIIRTQNGCTVKRHAVQKIDKRGFEPVEIMAVGFHVVGVNVGDHRHHGQQIEKRGVGLIGLHHDVVTRTQLGISAGAVQASADHKGRVHAGLSQYAGDQAGGGGFAVCAGNCNAALEPHQLGQHERARHHRDAFAAGGQHFRVVSAHSG